MSSRRRFTAATARQNPSERRSGLPGAARACSQAAMVRSTAASSTASAYARASHASGGDACLSREPSEREGGARRRRSARRRARNRSHDWIPSAALRVAPANASRAARPSPTHAPAAGLVARTRSGEANSPLSENRGMPPSSVEKRVAELREKIEKANYEYHV